ncbi:hypothetical protein [Chryseobacterium aquaticum]|uniref:hypothetical protein n=1 Tax=Chryseobacterium aquaticum TaxID=452084 RepID=UPI003F715CDE
MRVPNITTSSENIPPIEPIYNSLITLLDNNLHLTIEAISEAHQEYQKSGYTLKRDALTNEDDITTVIRRSLCDLESIFDFEFQTKDPEKNGGTDIGVLIKHTKPRNIPFCCIEAKVLPTPLSFKKRQETEYVCYRSSKKQGGIERFKTGTHGNKMPFSIMFAYIKDNNPLFWYNKINTWITEEINSTSNPIISWNNDDKLIHDEDFIKDKTTKYKSSHNRINSSSMTIGLNHYWLDLKS